MVKPSEVEAKAGRLEETNYKFRSYLKNHADIDELDRQFFALHNELFANYDCNSCRNCCKECNAVLNEDEIEAVAAYLQLSRDDLFNRYMGERDDDGYMLKGTPCCFLEENGACKIEGCKPIACKEYPHTNKPGRLWSLLSIVSAASVCPVVFEMLERLKAMYNFKPRRS